MQNGSRTPAVPSSSSERKSGSESKAPLSLPKGGGALKGLNEKFSVDAFTGSASLAVTIFSALGRLQSLGGVTAAYNSGNGNGMMGIGWSIGSPSVKRRTDKGVPKYGASDCTTDIFVAPGTDDLVRVSVELVDQWQVIRYRSRVEKSFSQVEHFVEKGSEANSFWRVISKENVTSVFGVTENGRIANPDDASQVFEWKLQAKFDDRGNIALFEYAVDEGEFHCHKLTASFPRRFRFGKATPFYAEPISGLQSQLEFEFASTKNESLFEIQFDYGPQLSTKTGLERLLDYESNPNPELAFQSDNGWVERPDKTSSHRSGFLIQTRRLCRRALVFHHLERATKDPLSHNCDGLVRSLEFHYDETPDVSNYASKLLAITQVNYRKPLDGEIGTAGRYVARCMPPMEFVYAPMPDLAKVEIRSADISGLPNTPDGATREWTDINTDGAPGLLVKAHSGAWTYYRNRGKGRLASGEAVVASPTAMTNSAAQMAPVQLIDLGADGSQDLVNLTPGTGWLRERLDDRWSTYKMIEQLPNIDFQDANTKLLDVNGDGLADVIITENDAIYWHRSMGEAGFDSKKRLDWTADQNHAPRILFSDRNQTLYTNDMSGDGLFDIVRIRNGDFVYWPNLGHGRFGHKVRMQNAPWFDHEQIFDPSRIKFADVDGSGSSDILYLGHEGIRCWRNQSGERWSEPVTIPFHSIHDPSKFSVVDFLANGTSCLVWTDEAPADPSRPLRYIHLAGAPPHTATECELVSGDCCHRDPRRIGQKPHLLIKSINNMGGETDFLYTTSAQFAAADRDAGRPWMTKLGFPVQVIERVERHDRITRRKTVEAYRYRHGYYDGKDREFRGFAYVEQRDTVSFYDFCQDRLAGQGIRSRNEQNGTQDATPAPSNAHSAFHVPPVVTKTWYHTGASYLNQTQTTRLRKEYFNEDPNAILLPDTQFEDILCGEDSHEACRSLKGSVLRQEIYSEDSDFCVSGDISSRPYSVSERSYTVRRLQGPVECRPHTNDPTQYRPQSVFMVFPDQQLDYQYERQLDDPRITQRFTLAVDDWGNVLQSANVAYGRRESGIQKDVDWLTDVEKDIQRKTYVSFTHKQFTNAVTATNRYAALNDQLWHVPVEYEERTWELSGFPRSGKSNYYLPCDFIDTHLNPKVTSLRHRQELQATAHAKRGKRSRRLIEQVRQLFVRVVQAGNQAQQVSLPLGVIETPVLPGKSFKLAFDAIPDLLRERSNSSAYSNNRDIEELLGGENGGGYLQSANIPEFSVGSEGEQGIQTVASVEADYWWAPAPFKQYLDSNRFFTPYLETDGFGNSTTTAYDYWYLLKQSITDAIGNHTSVNNDYRVLQPHRISDPNESVTDISFDTHGLVVASAIEGHAHETGDYLVQNQSYELADSDAFYTNPIEQRKLLLGSATTRILYDPLAYYRSVDVGSSLPSNNSTPQPVWSCVLARQKHVNQDADSEVEVTFAYTDGFFQEGQTVRLNQLPTTVHGDEESEPQPLWLTSGIRQLNNKGKPVREYEPFFTQDHQFDYSQHGVSKTLFYDPLERVVGTLHPDHSWEKTTFNAWGEIRWDRNDTVLLDPHEDPDLGGHFTKMFDDEFIPTWMDLQMTAELQPTKFIGSHANRHQKQMKQGSEKTSPVGERTNLQLVRDTFALNHNPVFRKRRHLKGIFKPPTPNSTKVASSAGTPERIYLDSLSKPFLAIADNRTNTSSTRQRVGSSASVSGKALAAGTNRNASTCNRPPDLQLSPPSPTHLDLFHTRTDHDIEGNQRAVTDAKDRVVMAWEYDMLGNAWCTEQMDWRSAEDESKPGKKVELLAIDGQPVAHWDERAHFVRTFYDPLRREKLVTVNGQVAEQFTYGEGQPDAKRLHLRGKRFQETVQNVGGAGPVTTTQLAYDWHDEPISQLRSASTSGIGFQPVNLGPVSPLAATSASGDYGQVAFDQLYGDGDPTHERGLTSASPTQAIQIQTRRDALGREYTINHDNVIEEIRGYNLLGQLNRISTRDLRNDTTKVPVSEMRYNARGQRVTLVNGGSTDGTEELLTTNHYDPLTYRMSQTVTRSQVGKWQDLAYQFDPVGNILQILDSSDYQLIFGHDDLVSGDQHFTYDSTYRLIQATGREHPAQVLAAHNSSNRDIPEAIRNGKPSANDATALVRYTEEYEYDSVGNMQHRRHKSSTTWTQQFKYETFSNRLRAEWIGRADAPTQQQNPLNYDNHGNTTSISPHLSDLDWDHNDRLMSAVQTASAAQANFAYDASGERTTKSEFGRTRIYFVATEQSGGTHSISLIDEARLCQIDTVLTGTIQHRHQINNHLGSARLELSTNQSLALESFEEHLPYGQTVFFISRQNKRYRFTGKERDVTTGFNYHSARYLDVTRFCWVSLDPIGVDDGVNRFNYASSNPSNYVDKNGEFLSLAATVAFAVSDTYQFATGQIGGKEFGGRMALNAVAAIADVATVGTGGGLAVRGIALGARATKLAKAAKVIDTTHTIYETGKATVAASTAIKKGDFAGAAINTTAAVLGGATLKKYRGRRAIQNLLPRTANGKANAGQYSKLKQLYKSLDTSKLEKPDLTRSQKRAVKGVENAIREHATFDDFRGVANEMTGHLIPKGGGEFFDHINEMSETSTRLSKLIGSLTGSLQNPQMDAKTREYLTESLGKAKYTLEKMSRAMNN